MPDRYAVRADTEKGRTKERSLITAFQRQIQEDLRCVFFHRCCFDIQLLFHERSDSWL